MLKEFREFAVRGNMVDMAVGIVIGVAFGAIIKSLVDDVLMPPIGLLLGGVDFSNLFVVLRQGVPPGPYASLADANAAGAVLLRIGLFFNAIVSFLIIAVAVFMVVKAVNAARRQQPPAPEVPPAPTPEQKLLGEIRDLLRTRAAG